MSVVCDVAILEPLLRRSENRASSLRKHAFCNMHRILKEVKVIFFFEENKYTYRSIIFLFFALTKIVGEAVF